MSDFFDSSMLISALSEDDKQHELSLPAWLGSKKRVMYSMDFWNLSLFSQGNFTRLV